MVSRLIIRVTMPLFSNLNPWYGDDYCCGDRDGGGGCDGDDDGVTDSVCDGSGGSSQISKEVYVLVYTHGSGIVNGSCGNGGVVDGGCGNGEKVAWC
jgi:hypothetical protein